MNETHLTHQKSDPDCMGHLTHFQPCSGSQRSQVTVQGMDVASYMGGRRLKYRRKKVQSYIHNCTTCTTLNRHMRPSYELITLLYVQLHTPGKSLMGSIDYR